MSHRIDTHHHIVPPRYLEQARERLRVTAHALFPQLLEWTPSRALETMGRVEIASAIMSISTPGIWFGDAGAARGLARDCNEYAAQLSGDHSGRFGFFAAVPLPDVDGSLREIEYALDVLHADGIGLMTNYDDRWPGEPAWAPVFDELDRRRAVVYFHPTASRACTNLLPGLPPATIEFPFDTTRAITSLLLSGTLSRCRNIRWIFSHGGGALPMVVGRLAGFLSVRKDLAAKVPNGVLPELRKLYYDVVGVANPIAFGAVRELAGIPQLLFGTDYPFFPPDPTVKGLTDLPLSADERRAIERDNAVRLLPRLQK
jgi:predicted TIM-barrel fold metal-dependent hydrolase